MVAPFSCSDAFALVRNGENFAVSDPTWPSHSECVVDSVMPGISALVNELVRVDVTQPV